MNPEAIQLLRNSIRRFVDMSDEDWSLLVPHLQYLELPKGDALAREGKRSDIVGFVLEGNMHHFYSKDGEDRTTYFYFEGHFVSAYISCITGQPSALTIEALTDCRLLIFSYSTLRQLYQASPAWERFGRLIAEYLAIGLEERMIGLLMDSPEERYIKLLEGNKQKIIERIPQHYIASYLGITSVSLSRIRKRLTGK